MLSTSEFPKGEGVSSSLADVLETDSVQQKYYLSPKACEGILRRANRTRQDSATSSTRSVNLASGKPIANTIPAELYHHGSVVNQDANNGHVVIEGFTSSSFAQYTQGVGTLRANGGDLRWGK
jgi:hypothetical protein